jgi:hypothetical protein
MSIGVIVEGYETIFDNAADGYITGTDGFGMPPLERFAERGAQQHGETDLGYRLQARRLTMVIEKPVSSVDQMYAARDRILKTFLPSSTITVFTRDGSRERRIDTVLDSAIPLPMDANWNVQKVAVVLKSIGVPAWYDGEAQSLTVDAGGNSNTTTIPMAIPTHVGSTNANTSQTLNYYGTWIEYPRVKITGPITNPKVVNNTTGEKLDFTGYTLAAGHSIEINTAYGKKTVLLDGVTNLLDKLTAESNLATFHLEPPSVNADFRENTINFTGTTITSATKLEIFYNNRYLGT